MQRRSFLARASAVGAWIASEGTFGATGARRLSVLLFDGPDPWQFFVDELRTEMAALGWVERRNLSIEWRFANGNVEQLDAVAAKVVASRPDAIVTRGTPATRALQAATTSIPILTGVGDPIGAGFARSLAAPGGNVTGVSWASVEMSVKQVELLRALVPQLATLRIVVPPHYAAPFMGELMRPMEDAARAARLAIERVQVAGAADLERAFGTDGRTRQVAAFVYGAAQVEPQAVTATALAAGMPTMFSDRGFVDAGGLASYRLYWDNQTRRTAAQVDKVLRGEKPARIPFELPTRSELALNKATARALGLTIPQSILLRADVVVE